MIRVAAFSDEPIAIEGLAALLRGSGEFELVGVEAEPEQLPALLPNLAPGVVLVDVDGYFSLAWLENLLRAVPGCPILLWTRNASLQVAYQAIRLGIKGIVSKKLRCELIPRCLRAVAGGELWFERGVTQRLVEARTIRLTRREGQLLLLVCQGLSNREIAETLSLSEGTVKFYLSRLYKKMRVCDRFELALYGLKLIVGQPVDKENLRHILDAGVPRSIVLEKGAGDEL